MQIYDKILVPTRKQGKIWHIQVTFCYIIDIQINMYRFRSFCYSCYSCYSFFQTVKSEAISVSPLLFLYICRNFGEAK
jgi:hypothetical protein